jgi:hypothetical protein
MVVFTLGVMAVKLDFLTGCIPRKSVLLAMEIRNTILFLRELNFLIKANLKLRASLLDSTIVLFKLRKLMNFTLGDVDFMVFLEMEATSIV